MKNIYEIEVNGGWFEVAWFIFRSWGGPRRLNGNPYVGNVYILGTDKVYAQVN